ncbi:YceI family protein [Chitinophaga sp. SYP-B3965]|uniref:YceI family protein n=1 Tax=Chitinophaga sp. SYP-B3965 TaxID=2663120 RepID=UPI0012997840|nr:YceI family protein [Chitinophaga sp. SYP-B3965]MRG47717.1 YceI family protein [Chitinophaga sp. SYP-B3965]
MKQLLLITTFLLTCLAGSGQEIYSCKGPKISFFSSAPMEDISAVSDRGVSAINIKTKAIYFKVHMNSFQFKKALMQEHFNENYVESEKFPFAEYKGKYAEDVDFSKNGTYPVNVEGTLNLHGVERSYKGKGTITVRDGKFNVNSKFNVTVADHKIKIPTLVVKNIAEVVEVTVNADYQPVTK